MSNYQKRTKHVINKRNKLNRKKKRALREAKIRIKSRDRYNKKLAEADIWVDHATKANKAEQSFSKSLWQPNNTIINDRLSKVLDKEGFDKMAWQNNE